MRSLEDEILNIGNQIIFLEMEWWSLIIFSLGKKEPLPEDIQLKLIFKEGKTL